MVGEVIGAILLGIVAGYIGKALMPGKDPGGCIFTIVLGIAGALVGYFLFTELLGIGDDDKFDFGGILGAIVGVMILLALYRAFFDPERKRASSEPHGSPRRRR